MYTRESQTTVFEKYECDACGKTAEFVTEYKRHLRPRGIPAEKVCEPDTGEWGTFGFSLTLQDSSRTEIDGEATYCSKACKKEAIKQAIANNWDK